MTEISSTIWSYFLNISNATENPTFDSLNNEVQNVDVFMILSTIIQNIFIIHQVSFIVTLYFSILFRVMSSLGFKSRVDSLSRMLHHLCAMDSSDSPLV